MKALRDPVVEDFAVNSDFFQAVFEIGRRHKVMNPEKMRSEYGKMIYLLQDSQMSDVQELLEFKLVKPLKTAHNLLASKNGLAMLNDGLMHQAWVRSIATRAARTHST